MDWQAHYKSVGTSCSPDYIPAFVVLPGMLIAGMMALAGIGAAFGQLILKPSSWLTIVVFIVYLATHVFLSGFEFFGYAHYFPRFEVTGICLMYALVAGIVVVQLRWATGALARRIGVPAGVVGAVAIMLFLYPRYLEWINLGRFRLTTFQTPSQERAELDKAMTEKWEQAMIQRRGQLAKQHPDVFPPATKDQPGIANTAWKGEFDGHSGTLEFHAGKKCRLTRDGASLEGSWGQRRDFFYFNVVNPSEKATESFSGVVDGGQMKGIVEAYSENSRTNWTWSAVRDTLTEFGNAPKAKQ